MGGAGFHEGEAFVGFKDDVGAAELPDNATPAPGGLGFGLGWGRLGGRAGGGFLDGVFGFGFADGFGADKEGFPCLLFFAVGGGGGGGRGVGGFGGCGGGGGFFGWRGGEGVL